MTKLENDYYKIFIYDNVKCLEETSKEAPISDFDSCVKKVKAKFEIKLDLINIIVMIKDKNDKITNTSFAFGDPITGELLDIGDTCSNENIEIAKDLVNMIEELEIDNQKKEILVDLVKQGINIFDPNDKFYQDLCYYYDSPVKKDIPMRDRVSLYYPNLTLCESGCTENGIDYNEMKVKCICVFKSFINKDYLNNNLYGESINEILKFIQSLNIECIECIAKVFKSKYFPKCIGGFISIALLVIQLACIKIFTKHGFKIINKHIFNILDAFRIYKKNHDISSPPKKYNNSDKNLIEKEVNDVDVTKIRSSKKLKKAEDSNSEKKESKNKVSEYRGIKTNSGNRLKYSENERIKENKEIKIIDKVDVMNENRDKYLEIIKDYINPPFDEDDFEEVVEKDERTFCQYFTEKFVNNQIFINTFYISEELRPRSLKILVLSLTIELYFIVNALFYTEDYLSERYNSTEEESFFSFIPNRINEFIYVSCINGVIAYLISYIFDNEETLIQIFKKNKKKKKERLDSFMKDIERKFIALMIISVIISIFSFMYLSSFNVVYPYIRIEWVKSSCFILILMQIINLLFSLFETIFRFWSIKCNSLKLFRLSKLLD